MKRGIAKIRALATTQADTLKKLEDDYGTDARQAGCCPSASALVTLRESSMSAQPSKASSRRSSTTSAKRPARALLTDVRELILQARAGVARAVDSGLVTLYWHVGRRIRQDILKDDVLGDGAEEGRGAEHGRFDAALEVPGGLEEDAAHVDHGDVRRAEMLLRPVVNRTHRFGDGGVLDSIARQSGEVQRLLQVTIDHVVIVFAAQVAEGVRDEAQRRLVEL